jgi:hypothetical protein
MSGNRHTFHRASRCAVRSVVRRSVRVRWRGSDDLGLALGCFRRAITAHRRLARLSPQFFDSARIERERQEDEERRRWAETIEAALAKIYGTVPEPTAHCNAAFQPPLPPPRTVAAVEHQLATWTLCFATAKEALKRFRRRHPHALLSLHRLVRLTAIASELGWLAVGLDSPQSSKGKGRERTDREKAQASQKTGKKTANEEGNGAGGGVRFATTPKGDCIARRPRTALR